MRLLFVGDGPRDFATVPFLVESILATSIEAETSQWARLQGPGHGYKRKLLYALRQARDLRVDGLVATVDRDADKPRRRLNQLRAGLNKDREGQATIPAALGEAVPHGDAWLLDDSAAVRQVLDLAPETNIPTVRESENPKGVLDRLISDSSRDTDRMKTLREIARVVDVGRCTSPRRTGFEAFVGEVRDELGPLVADERPPA